MGREREDPQPVRAGAGTVGNILMQFSLMMLSTLQHTGGFGLHEHPAEPFREEATSSWYLDSTKAVAEHPSASVVTIEEGKYGQIGKKPDRCASAKPADTGVVSEAASMGGRRHPEE